MDVKTLGVGWTRGWKGVALATLLLAVCGCEPPVEVPPVPVVNPASGPLSGYFPVTVTLTEDGPAADQVTAVRVGGVAAYGLTVVDERTLSFVVQGYAEGDAVDIELETGDGVVVIADAFTYEGPLDPAFERVYSVGASFAQGVQAGVPSQHAVLASPSHRLATQLGAHMPLPQLVPDLFPAMGVADLGPPPDCEVPLIVSYLAWSAMEALERMKDPETGIVGFQNARVDPGLEVRNFGVGGFRVREVLHSPDEDDFYRQFLAHIVYDPFAEIYDVVPASPVELVEVAEPTLVFSVDLFGNDLIDGYVQGNDIDSSEVTPVESFEVDLTETLARLSATGAQVFVANAPQPGVLPAAAERKRWLLAQGYDTAEHIDEELAAIDALAETFNQILDEKAAEHDNVHVVDLSGIVEEVSGSGITVGDELVTVERFGGLVSIDGLHFSDTGYAVLTNAFVDTINETLGTSVPAVDLQAVLAADPFAPANLVAAGLDVEACEL